MKSSILITAYAVNPYKGSEDGIAWNIIRQMSNHNKIVAITRENNRAPIEKYIAANPLDKSVHLEFAYFDLPYWMRFWKKGSRGALLYHYLWHLAVVLFIWRKKFQFDLAHHLNFNNDWTPSFLWLLGKPFIWGPIGHHPKVPKEYIKVYGFKAWFLEQVKWGIKKCFWHLDPFLKITKWKAAKIIALNSSVQKVLNVAAEKIIVIPAAGTERPTLSTATENKFTVLSIGRLVSLKGFDISIEAFAQFYKQLPAAAQAKTQLVLIGKGPQKKFLVEIIKKHNLPTHTILLKDWMERSALAQYYTNAKVFLFPSHEGAGMVVPEALSYGIPVLCFKNVGPGELIDEHCGIAIPYGTRADSITQFAKALDRLYQEPTYQKELSINASKRFKNQFTWEGKGLAIQEIYTTALDKQPLSTPLLEQEFTSIDAIS